MVCSLTAGATYTDDGVSTCAVCIPDSLSMMLSVAFEGLTTCNAAASCCRRMRSHCSCH